MPRTTGAQPKPAVPATTVRSMTGYGRATVEDGGRVTAEVRAVNGRFLKLSVKVLGRYAALEERVRELLGELGIKRGNIDVGLFFDDASSGDGGYGINEAAVKHFITQARALSKKHKLKGDVPLSSILPLPGVIVRESPEEDIEKVWDRSKRALQSAIADFDHMRARDGAACVADIRARLADLARRREAIAAAAPEAVKGAIRKFKDRIEKLLADAKVAAPLNPDVLEREVVLMADRLDIGEELSRLQSHFEQMEAAMTSGGEAGKKLDFLTQELFRETNTIGSKAQDQNIVHHVVEMKGLIEKIREQAQNLE